MESYYKAPLTETQKGDEFVTPTAVVGSDGKPVASISNGDAVLFYNYRGDRPREITKAFVFDDFKGFDRGPKLDLYYATMTEYETGLPVHVVAMKPPPLKNILGQVVSDAGIAQFRCAETEKFPHVTFFFNDYREDPYSGEDRQIVPSPRDHRRSTLTEGGVMRTTISKAGTTRLSRSASKTSISRGKTVARTRSVRAHVPEAHSLGRTLTCAPESRKSQVASRKSQVASRKSQVASRKSRVERRMDL